MKQNKSFKYIGLLLVVGLLFAALPTGQAQAQTGMTIKVGVLDPSWTAPGGGGVFAAYLGPTAYDYAIPGSTALYDGREAGIIKAGINIDANGHYLDEGILAFKVNNVPTSTFATQALSYEVQNETGPNPVWVRIRFVDGTTFQFVPASYGVLGGYHVVNAKTGLWQLMTSGGGATGPLMTLSALATAYPTALVDRVYLALGQGDSYHGTGNGTIGWVDKVVIDTVTYDFVVGPVAQGQNVTTAEDTNVYITLAATDLEGDPLTYSIVNPPTNGTAVLGGGNVVLYTPASNYNGPDFFDFEAKNGRGIDYARVNITVTAVNDAPVAEDQTVTTAEDTAASITLVATDADGGALIYSIVTQPTHGTLIWGSAGLTYTPALNYHGPDSFTFKANDGSVDSNVATVTITVTAVNDAPPVASDQHVTTAEDTAASITLVATDVDLDTLTYTVITDPEHGTLSGTAPALTYTPTANYNGSDSFTFKANDGTADGNVATVTITVTAVNDAPVASNKSVSTAEDTAASITLAATDVEGGTLTYSIVTQPTHGNAVLVGNVVTYTPALNYNGPDSFTFKANDGSVDSNVATVTISVTPVKDDPMAVNDFYDTNQDTTLVVKAADGVMKNDTDIDLNTMTTTLLTSVTHGTLTLLGDGSFTYTPASGFFGTDTFTYQLVTYPSPAVVGGWTDEALVTITVHEVPVPMFFYYLPLIAK